MKENMMNKGLMTSQEVAYTLFPLKTTEYKNQRTLLENTVAIKIVLYTFQPTQMVKPDGVPSNPEPRTQNPDDLDLRRKKSVCVITITRLAAALCSSYSYFYS